MHRLEREKNQWSKPDAEMNPQRSRASAKMLLSRTLALAAAPIAFATHADGCDKWDVRGTFLMEISDSDKSAIAGFLIQSGDAITGTAQEYWHWPSHQPDRTGQIDHGTINGNAIEFVARWYEQNPQPSEVFKGLIGPDGVARGSVFFTKYPAIYPASLRIQARCVDAQPGNDAAPVDRPGEGHIEGKSK